MSLFSRIEREVLVTGRTEVADGVVAVDLAAANGRDLPPWTPGSHIDLILPDGSERQYSLCGDAADRSTWRCTVLLEPAGRGGSAWIHEELLVGQRLRARGPRNHFAFDPAAGQPALFIAGGIGITPFVAMVTAAQASGVDWTLKYAGRSQSTMAFATEMQEFGRTRVQLYSSADGERMDLAALRAATPDDTAVYACGPTRLLDAVEALWPDVHLERFEAKEFQAPVWAGPFELELALSGLTVTVEPERSILDVVEENDILVISSCRKGTCGSCETPIVAGEVEHRDSVLSPGEQADNSVMMICVSRAAGPRIVLDL
jgi:ferredoxin-NADP reductase